MDAMNTGFSPRAEFWQCMAQTLLPLRGETLSRALHEDLVADLEDLAGTLDLNIGDEVEQLRTVLAQTEAEALLPAYSSLFLVPPIPAKLNACIYLDGTLLGANAKMLADILGRYGVMQSPDMHDTPDHVATILEFLALLLHETDMAEPEIPQALADDMTSVRKLLLRVLPEIAARVAATEVERELPQVYSALLNLILTALRDEQHVFFAADVGDATNPARRYFSKRQAAPDMVACKACGKPVATARELNVIITRLRQSGLPTDHLELCPDCRDGARGWAPGKAEFNLPGFH